MKSKKGFTLIEVIISIAALGIICAVLLKLFVLAGSTNKKAGDIQSAQVAVASVVETLAGSDDIHSALASMGLTAPAGGACGQYVLPKDDYTVVLDISEDNGDYPGALYDFKVTAVEEDRELVSIATSKYYAGVVP